MDTQEPSRERPPIGKLARGAWYGLWVQGVDKALPVALMLYLARTLDPVAFGVYGFVVAYLAFFQIVSEYGVDTVLVRAMSQAPERAVALLQAGLGLKLATALGSVAVAAATVELLSGGRTSWSLMLVASLTLPTALGGAYRSFFRARLQIKPVFLIAATRAVMLATAVIAAVAADAGLEYIFAAMAVANVATFAAVFLFLRKSVEPRIAFDAGVWRELAAGAWPLIVNALAMTVSLRAGQILLMSMRGPVEVGRMSAAGRVVESFTLLPEALMLTIYPLMAGLHAERPEALIKAASQSSRYLAIASGVPVLLCAVAGTEVMTLLFGAAFADAGDVLSLLALTALLAATGTVIVNLLVAVHEEKTLYRSNVAFAAVNVALSALLIPHYGELGAAAAMLAASAGAQVVLALLPGTGAYVRAALLPGLGTFAAVAVGFAAAWTIESGPAARIAAALVAYSVGLVVFGVINREEIRFIRHVWSAAVGSGGVR